MGNLVPSLSVDTDFSELKKAVEFYGKFLDGDADLIEDEYLRGQRYWKRCESHERSKQVVETLGCAKKLGTYSKFSTLLQVFQPYLLALPPMSDPLAPLNCLKHTLGTQ